MASTVLFDPNGDLRLAIGAKLNGGTFSPPYQSLKLGSPATRPVLMIIPQNAKLQAMRASHQQTRQLLIFIP